jgi:hypothetical protein
MASKYGLGANNPYFKKKKTLSKMILKTYYNDKHSIYCKIMYIIKLTTTMAIISSVFWMHIFPELVFALDATATPHHLNNFSNFIKYETNLEISPFNYYNPNTSEKWINKEMTRIDVVIKDNSLIYIGLKTIAIASVFFIAVGIACCIED